MYQKVQGAWIHTAKNTVIYHMKIVQSFVEELELGNLNNYQFGEFCCTWLMEKWLWWHTWFVNHDLILVNCNSHFGQRVDPFGRFEMKSCDMPTSKSWNRRHKKFLCWESLKTSKDWTVPIPFLKLFMGAYQHQPGLNQNSSKFQMTILFKLHHDSLKKSEVNNR